MKSLLKKTSVKYSSLVIFIYILIIPLTNTNHHKWSKKNGVINFDVKSYYAYLPAAIIYKDLSLEFLKEKKELNKWIWPLKSPTGKQAITTSMGLAFVYAPFFLLAHTFASISPSYAADGYSLPYHYALAFSTFFYFVLGLFVLRKFLKKYFSDRVTAFTLFIIGFGTNLFFYLTYEATMPHGYNFVLISIFIYLVDKWHDKQNVKNTIYLGLLSGLIALIRPTNIIALLLIPLWRIGSLKELKSNIELLLTKWHLILLMAACFVLVWIPQFAYWKFISGQFFYYSYGEKDAHFFFSNPQFWNVLFSYKKGWFVYTPIMLIATLAIPLLFNKRFKLGFAVSVYWLLTVYLIASWWCWWFGGSFGQRSLIDFYALMSIPLAALIDQLIKRKRILKISGLFLIFALVAFNQFNIQQMRHQAIHHWWMNKEAYWTNFLKLKPSCKYWHVIMIPDYEKARKGIYQWKPSNDKERDFTDKKLIAEIIKKEKQNLELIDSLANLQQYSGLSNNVVIKRYANHLVKNKMAAKYYDELNLEFYKSKIKNCKSWQNDLQKQANKNKLTLDEMILNEAHRVYNSYGKKYVKQ